jgi:hypothetical protein
MHMVSLKDVDEYVKILVSYVCTSREYIKHFLMDPSKPKLVIARLFHKNKIFSSEPRDSKQNVDVLVLIIFYIIYIYF